METIITPKSSFVISGVEPKYTKVKSKEELELELLKYKSILSIPIYDYLNQVLNLDITIVRDYIPEDTKKVLSNLTIYNDIGKYNIYNRAIKLFEKEEMNIGFLVMKNSHGELVIKSKEINKPIFKFNYNEGEKEKNTKIGNISIYQTSPSIELTKQDISSIKEEIEKKKSLICPYGSYLDKSNPNKGWAYSWEMERTLRIDEFNHYLEKIDTKVDFNKKTQFEISLTKYVYSLLKEEYGLCKEFELEELRIENHSKNKTRIVPPMDNLVLEKKLSIKMPNLVIDKNTKYIENSSN